MERKAKYTKEFKIKACELVVKDDIKTKTLRRSSKSAKNCARKIASATRCKTNAIQSLEQKVQDLFGVLSSCRSQRFAEKGLGKKKDKFVNKQFLSA